MTVAHWRLRHLLAAAGCALAIARAPALYAEAASKPAKTEKPPETAENSPAKTDERIGDSHSAAGPRSGSGTRSVEPKPPPAAKAATASASGGKDATSPTKRGAKPAALPKSARPAHQIGRAPKAPRSTLPPGAPPAQPNQAGRRLVAGGATTDELRAKTDDPELRALREAERALFPKPLAGVQPGWAWDLPRPVEDAGPEVRASGTPPSVRLEAAPDPAASPQTAEWLRTLTLPNLPVRLDARVVKYLEFYRDSARGRAIALAWAKKSGRYVAALRAELAKSGLPTDLVWLSLIESSHNPTIVSPAGAAGLWQFMPPTGRLYGLTVDRWVDERFDPQRSTEAAIRHLSDLYRRFGSWELAMAAYNMGYGGLTLAIRKFNTNDFWELCHYEAGIPWETTLYVPKIFAIAIVMNNKKAFGLLDVVPDEAVSFDTVLVDPAIPLEQVAAAANVPLAEIELLNRQYLAGRTPPTRPGQRRMTHAVRVPTGKANLATQRLAKTSSPETTTLEPYAVRLGDTVQSIAAARKTSEPRLRQLNRIARGEVLKPGTVLLAPRASGDPDVAAGKAVAAGAPDASGAADTDEVVVVPPRQFSYPDRQRVFYRVRHGDTLGTIAQAFGVTRPELVAWNSIDEAARLQTAMALQVFVHKRRSLTGIRHVKETQTRVLVAGSPEFFDYFEGLKGRKRLKVVARRGDSLRTIGARYGMSIGWMERINRRSRSDKLEPGDIVIVYADRRVPEARVDPGAVAAAPLPSIEAPRPEALPPVTADGAPRQSGTAAP